MPRLLILCEGKTEPIYFLALVRDLDLPSVSVRSPKRGQWGAAGIATTVQRERERDSDLDEIWCILDHDERAKEIQDFRDWLEQNSHGKRGATKIRVALSTPCFEYWLLLHFRYTNRPFRGTPGGSSACEQVIRELETHLEGYRKADAGTYDRCRERISTAIRNAKRAQQSEGESSTDVWKLVERLRRLRTTKRTPVSR